MTTERAGRFGAAAALVIAAAGIPAALTPKREAPQKRTIAVVARKYAYDPPVVTVNQGDEVHLTLASRDVTHGFYLEGYDLDAVVEAGKSEVQLRRPSLGSAYAPAREIVFTASQRGKFRYRCSMTCGYMHPFMQGVLIVRPNALFGTAAGLMIGLFLAALALAWPAEGPRPQPVPETPPVPAPAPAGGAS